MHRLMICLVTIASVWVVSPDTACVRAWAEDGGPGEDEQPAATDEDEEGAGPAADAPVAQPEVDNGGALAAPDEAPLETLPPDDAPQPSAPDPPGLGPPAAPAPPTEDALTDDRRFRLGADRVRVEDGATVAEGQVKVEGRELQVSSQSAMVDADQVWAHFVGNVTIGTREMSTTATSLDINLETRKWRAHDARTVVQPAFFTEGVVEPVYLRADTVHTPEDRNIIVARECTATSCDLDRPHYHLQSDRVRVLPGQKVVFERPALYMFGRRVFRFPFDLTLAIDEKQNRFIPEIGENTVEGKYAKFAYVYWLNEQNSGLARLHFTEKRGTGYGFDHYIDASEQSVVLTLFHEPSEGALTSRINHQWAMSDSLTWSLTSDLQRNSGFFGATQTWNTNWGLRRLTAESSSHLGVQRSTTETGAARSQRFTTSLSHQQRHGPNTNWDMRASFRDNRYRVGQPADREMDANFRFQDRRDWYDWQMLAENRWDLSDDPDIAPRRRLINRLPQVTLNTDSRRLEGRGPFGWLDTRASVELGRYEQLPEELTVNRAALRLDFPGADRRIGPRTRLRASGRYYQSFYDDDSAQFLAALNTELRQELSGHWSTRLTANYARPQGYSPIRIDYWGSQRDSFFQAVRLSPDRSRIDLSVGYDFITDAWRTALGQFEFMTSRNSKLTTQTGYDIERSQWRPVNAAWTLGHPGRLRLTLGAHYSIDDSKLWQSSLDLDWRLRPDTRLEFLGRYSGFTKKVDQMDVRLTRDLHCWVTSVSFSRPRNEWQVNIGLKAFPSVQTNFGATRGAQFQSGAGMYY